MDKQKNNDRFESYPRPSESDRQLQNQPEFINEQPEELPTQSVGNVSDNKAERLPTDPEKEIEERK